MYWIHLLWKMMSGEIDKSIMMVFNSILLSMIILQGLPVMHVLWLWIRGFDCVSHLLHINGNVENKSISIIKYPSFNKRGMIELFVLE